MAFVYTGTALRVGGDTIARVGLRFIDGVYFYVLGFSFYFSWACSYFGGVVSTVVRLVSEECL